MAYDPANPPALVSQRVGATGGARWYYSSTDALADINTEDYFTDGYDLGMREGDIVDVVNPTTFALSTYVVGESTEDTTDLTDGSVVDSGADAD